MDENVKMEYTNILDLLGNALSAAFEVDDNGYISGNISKAMDKISMMMYSDQRV